MPSSTTREGSYLAMVTDVLSALFALYRALPSPSCHKLSTGHRTTLPWWCSVISCRLPSSLAFLPKRLFAAARLSTIRAWTNKIIKSVRNWWKTDAPTWFGWNLARCNLRVEPTIDVIYVEKIQVQKMPRTQSHNSQVCSVVGYALKMNYICSCSCSPSKWLTPVGVFLLLCCRFLCFLVRLWRWEMYWRASPYRDVSYVAKAWQSVLSRCFDGSHFGKGSIL